MVQLNPVPFFAAIKKIPEPFDGNFFTEISVLYISVKNLIMKYFTVFSSRKWFMFTSLMEGIFFYGSFIQAPFI